MSGRPFPELHPDSLHSILATSGDPRHSVSVWGGRDNVQIHHVIPTAVANNEIHSGFIKSLADFGYRFDLNDASNILPLPINGTAAAKGAGNGVFGAIHLRSDAQHIRYSQHISDKLREIQFLHGNELAALGPKAAAERAGQRIDALKAETMDLLTGPTKDSVKLFLNNNDPILWEQYKAANPSTGPPEYDSKGRMTEEWRNKLADFQSKNYDLIDFNRAPSFLDASTTRSIKTILDDKPSGAVGTAALAITGASVVKMLKDKYGDLSPEQIATMVRSMGIDPKALLGVAGEITAEAALQILARTLGGPVAIAVSAYDLYQNFASLRGSLKLYEDAFDSKTVGKLNAAIDAAEAKVKALVGSRPDRKLTPEQVEQVNRDIEKATGISLIDQCFAAGTPILMADGSLKPIEAVRAGDRVMAFDGPGALEPRTVTALHRSVTSEWIVLRFPGDAARGTLAVTPEHPFLTKDGAFVPIGTLLARSPMGLAEVVLADGSHVTVSGRRVRYCAETADMFGQAEAFAAVHGALAVARPGGWATYNFEVEGLHTYVAGGLRVHNLCVLGSTGKDFENNFLVEALESMGLMAERNGEVVRSITLDGQEFLFVREQARITHADGTVTSAADFVGMLAEGTRTLVDVIGGQLANLPNHLADVAPAIIADLVMGRDLEKVAEQYAIQMATTMGVSALAQLLGLESRRIGFELVSGKRYPVIDGVKFLDTAEGQAIKGGIMHFAVVAALRGSEMNSGDWAKLAANASIRSAVTYVVKEHAGAWAANSLVTAYTSTGAKVTTNVLTPAGAGAVAAGITFFSNLIEKGFKDFDQTLLQTAIAGGTAYVGAKIGAMLGWVVPGIGNIIGAVIGSLIGNALGGLFGGRKLPPPPPLVHIETNPDGTQTIQVSQHSTGYTIAAREGFDDVLVGGARFDALIGSSGNNRMFGQGGDDLLLGHGGHDLLDGGDGRDELHGGSGDDTLIGGAGNDRLFGDEHIDSTGLSGSAAGGNDVVLADAGDDEVHAGGGNDHVEGGAGRDTLQGGHGDDTVIGGDDADAVLGGAGNDVLYGDTVVQDTAAGTITISGTSADSLQGGDGNDTIYGGGGNDTIDGGSGNDLIHGDGVLLRRVGTQTEASLRDSGADVLDGGEGNDTIVAGAGNDILRGGAGNDDLDAGDGNDNVQGGAGNDVLRASAGRDTMDGGDGDDRIAGGADDDVLTGGAGRDDLDGGAGNDQLTAGAGDDILRGDLGNDVLLGEAGNDLALGGIGEDSLSGADGADTLLGEIGRDTVDGGAGNDSISGGADGDAVSGGAGADTINGGDGHDIVSGGADNDLVRGDAGSDRLRGDEGADTLEGADGSDTLDGGAGDDVLLGGGGQDRLILGAGRDRLEGGAGDDTYEVGAGGSGTIADLSGNDVLVLNGISGARDLLVARDGQDLLVSSRTNTAMSLRIEGHFSGLGGAIEAIRLADGFTLNISNLIIGTNGSDSLVGTDDADGILGLGGNDAIFGEGGDDFLDGGDGEDVIFAGAGNDVVHGSGEDDMLAGDTGDDTIVGGAGDDIMVGAQGADVFVADRTPATRDVVADFELSRDRIDLSRFGDRFVNLKQMTMFGDRGISQAGQGAVLALGAGAQLVLDNVQATSLRDEHFVFDLRAIEGVTGTDSNEAITGSAADDVITDGRGFDVMTGGAGRDTFQVTAGAGDIDTIRDFTRDQDRLDLSAVAELQSVAQLDVEQVGADTVVHLAGGQKIILENVQRSSLADEDLVTDRFVDLTGQPRYSGPVEHDFGADGASESNADVLPNGVSDIWRYAEGRWNLSHVHFAPGAQYSGSSIHQTNLWTAENFSNTWIDQTLYNNEYWVQVGGKRKSWELRRDTDFYGSGWDDQMIGSWWSERIFAGSGNDLVYGGAGHDQIYGSDGNDYLFGNEDNDTIWGEAGHDALFGGTGFDVLYGTFGNDALYGESENDTLVGEQGDDLLDGGTGDDHLYGQWDRDWILGGDGQDYLFGEDGDDYLNGQNGNDTGYGGHGNDFLEGEDGADYLSGQEGNDRLFGGGGADQLLGDLGNDELVGGWGTDTLFGGMGSDYLAGGEGNDFLRGGTGMDILHGNEGNDTLLGDDRAGDYAERGEMQTFSRIVDRWVSDGKFGWWEKATEYYQQWVITDRDFGASDLLFGGDGNDAIHGFDGHDIGYGGSGEDRMFGGGGQDALFGEDGDDYIKGEDGHDLIVGGAGRDWLHGGAGVDLLYGEGGNDILHGAGGTDLLIGGDGSDHLLGGGNADVLLGGDDHDLLLGQDGNDHLHGEGGDDILEGGTGDDWLTGGAGKDSLNGGVGNDGLSGEAGNDILDGAEGADWISGGDGADIIRGGSGTDVLTGGRGADILSGGADADLIRFEDWADTTRSGADIIVDFDARADRIDLSALKVEFGRLRFAVDGEYTEVSIDGSDFFFKIAGREAIQQSNFQF